MGLKAEGSVGFLVFLVNEDPPPTASAHLQHFLNVGRSWI